MNNSNDKIKCPKCGGTGYLPHFAHVDEGLCFDCHGAGWIDKETYEKIEQEEQKSAKKAERRFASDLKKARGFFNDVLYFVTGNTFGNKQELKDCGAKWNQWLYGWTFTEPHGSFPTIAINYDDVKEFSIKQLQDFLEPYRASVPDIKPKEKLSSKPSSATFDLNLIFDMLDDDNDK